MSSIAFAGSMPASSSADAEKFGIIRVPGIFLFRNPADRLVDSTGTAQADEPELEDLEHTTVAEAQECLQSVQLDAQLHFLDHLIPVRIKDNPHLFLLSSTKRDQSFRSREIKEYP
jgi:hypothetical protein